MGRADVSRILYQLLSLLFWLLLSFQCVPQVASQILTSTLHSTEYGLKFAYDGETVRFTCVAEGNSMAWSSDEYIGSDGNRLEFVAIERKGTEYRAGQTVATLVDVSSVNGLTILESLLQISVRSAFQTSSIRCHNLGSDTVNTISFETSGNTSITCDKLSACTGETVRCTCITGYSNTLAWSSNQLIGPNDARLEFVSIDSVNMTLKVPGSNTVAVLTDVSRQNGVMVLSSDLTFVADKPANILTCANVDQQSSDSKIIPMSKNCMPVSTPSLSTPNATTDLAVSTEIICASSSPRSDNSNVIIGVSVFFSTIVVVLLSVIFVLVIKIILIRKPYKKDDSGSYEDHRATNFVAMVHDGDQGEPATSQDVSILSTSNDSKETEPDSKEDSTQEKSTTAISVGPGAEMKESLNIGPRNAPVDGQIEKGRTEDTVKLELHVSHESTSPKLQQSESESEGGATGWAQFSEDECKKCNENEIIRVSDVAMMALVAAMDTQKEVFQEVQERNGKKKFVDTLMEDVFENIRNNSEDAISTGGLTKRAQADN